ncbi:MAG: S-methyl-5-thioribose-1-phosphate isomerase [Bdellovibrionales bacterium]|nr:S-methyl-5-thioribose-1-phosphate isomerase [Bdellovibrionales bacterium]
MTFPLISLGIRYEPGRLEILDQQVLPHEVRWLRVESVDAMIEAIQALKVRGAPLIGVAAALALAECGRAGTPMDQVWDAGVRLRGARPTAVNLMAAVDRMMASLPLGLARFIATAESIFREDQELCERIARNGAPLIEDGDSVLTHCNAGGLATAGIGTALGVIRVAHESGKKIHVYVDETRPLLQGGRLTAWELEKLGIPYTIICDNMAATLMRSGRIQKAIVGADRIAYNGDFANKVGTYGVAVLCRFHSVPFFVAGPRTTFDAQCPGGAEIPVELRAETEVLGLAAGLGGLRWSPAGAQAWNPSFDVTPSELVSAYVFEKGVVTQEDLKARSLGDWLKD